MDSQPIKHSNFMHHLLFSTSNIPDKFLNHINENLSITNSKKTNIKSPNRQSQSSANKCSKVIEKKTKFITKNKRNNFLKKFGAFLEGRSVEQTLKHFYCPICLEIIVKATPTPCGHMFCKKCLYDSLVYFGSCPICRRDLSQMVFVNYSQMDRLIQQTLKKIPNESMRKNYQMRYREFIKQDNNKKIKIKALEKSNLLDILDETNIWRQGKIKQIHIQNQETIFFKIHFKNQKGQSEQYLNANSDRIAIFKTYTKNCTEKYINTSGQQSMIFDEISYRSIQNNSISISQFQNIQLYQNISHSEIIVQENASYDQGNNNQITTPNIPVSSIIYNTIQEQQKFSQQPLIDMNEVFNFSDFADLSGQNTREKQSSYRQIK